MSDEDEHDHSLLDRHHHHLMDLYRNPFLTSPALGQNASPAILGTLVIGLLVWELVEYWTDVLQALLTLWALALLAMVALVASVALIAWLRRPVRHRQPQDRKRIAFETAKTPTQIPIINSSPEYERYFWSPDDPKLVEQWRRYHEEDVKPIRRNKPAPATPAATAQPKAPPLSPEAQKIIAQINASRRLARHAWSTDESGLREQWQRYQTHGQLPIRRSRLEKQLARMAKPPQG